MSDSYLRLLASIRQLNWFYTSSSLRQKELHKFLSYLLLSWHLVFNLKTNIYTCPASPSKFSLRLHMNFFIWWNTTHELSYREIVFLNSKNRMENKTTVKKEICKMDLGYLRWFSLLKITWYAATGREELFRSSLMISKYGRPGLTYTQNYITSGQLKLLWN